MNWLSRISMALFAGVALVSCGGGGGGAGATAPADLTLPPSVNAQSNSPLQVQAVYQPGVRSLGNDPAGPQLVEASPEGRLVFSRATSAKVGDVLIVEGKGYVVTAVEQNGAVLLTRPPELGQVFESLAIRGTVDTIAAPAASGLSSVLRSVKLVSLGEVDGKLSYSYDFFMLPEIKATLGVNVGVKAKINYGFVATKGVTDFDVTATIDLGEFINLSYEPPGAATDTSGGIEVKRWIIPISQIPGVATLEIPLMVSAQYTGEAKTSVALQSGATQYVITALLNKVTGKIETSGTLSGSSTAGAPTLVSPIPVETSAKLGLAFKVGPDVQFKLLAGTLSPVTVGVRGVTDLSGEAKNDGKQTCLGWKIELKGELGAELKLTEALKLGATYATPAAELSTGGNLTDCEAPPPSTPPAAPSAPTSPASVDAVSTPEGEALLPSPTGLPMLTDYDFRLVVNYSEFTQDPVSTYCSNIYLYGQGPGIEPTWVSCNAGIGILFYPPGGSVPVGGSPAEQFWEGIPSDYAYESGVCRFSAPVYDQLDYVDLGVTTYRQYNGKTVEFDARSGLRFANFRVRPVLSPAIRRVVSGASPYQTYTFRYVCQMVLAKRSNPVERYFVRAEKVFSDFYYLGGAYFDNAAGFVTLK